MQKIAWDKELQLGIGLIDDHHKELVGLANELIQAANMVGKPRTLTHYLTRLREHAASHLRTEESIMATRRYRRRSEHTLQNERFRATMKQLHNHLKVAEDLTDHDMAMLRDSLVHHIKDSNRAIARSIDLDQDAPTN